MDRRLRLSISFKKQYRHVYEHLQKQGNKSEYIAKLVERDIQERPGAEIRDEIRRIVLEVIQHHTNFLPASLSNATAMQSNEGISKEDADLINQLF